MAVLMLAIGAGVLGAGLGYSRYGVAGAVVGFPVGLGAGVVAAVAMFVAFALVVIGVTAAVAYLKGGCEAVRAMFRDPPAPPPASGECHGNG